ncbi:hypothetical protein [Streptomyces sp. NPDC054765]
MRWWPWPPWSPNPAAAAECGPTRSAPCYAGRAAVHEAFASGIGTSRLVGAAAVFLGGLVAAVLRRRAERTGQDAGPLTAPAGSQPAPAAAE